MTDTEASDAVKKSLWSAIDVYARAYEGRDAVAKAAAVAQVQERVEHLVMLFVKQRIRDARRLTRSAFDDADGKVAAGLERIANEMLP